VLTVSTHSKASMLAEELPAIVGEDGVVSKPDEFRNEHTP